MAFLNKKSTEIFCRLIDSLNGTTYRKIINPPYMPLSIERIEQGIDMPMGSGDTYSLCHYYEQNGDLMQDPEMCFVMVDGREGNAEAWDKVTVVPFMFRQANLGIYQESVAFKDNKPVSIKIIMQEDHTEFADQWLQNIYHQGFLA